MNCGKHLHSASILAAGVLWGLYSIFSKIGLSRYHPFTVVFYTFLFAAICTAPFADLGAVIRAAARHPQVTGWGFSIALVSTVAPYILYTIGLQKVEAGKAAIMATTEPVTGCLLGFFAYGESHDLSRIIGILMILLSIVVLNVKTSPRGLP